MYPNTRIGSTFRSLIATLCAVLVLSGEAIAIENPQSQSLAPATATQTSKIPPEQLDSLVAPVALYSAYSARACRGRQACA